MVFLLQKTLIFAIPLLIVALAGMFSERSGIINIALDGIMIFGAFAGAMAAFFLRSNPYFVTHNQLLFLICLALAAVMGALFSLLLSFSAINLKADQTIGGTALNLLAPAITLFITKVLFNKDKLEMETMINQDGGRTDFGYAILNEDINPAAQILFDKTYISTFIAIIVFVLLSFWIYKTKTGLRLRSCGEHPQAAASVGINVQRMRYLGVTISGALAGFGGYAFVATVANGTAEGTVAGMGFLALAIMIFGNWKPLGIALGSLLFGFLKCLAVTYERSLIEPLESTSWMQKILQNSQAFSGFYNAVFKNMYFYNLIPFVTVLIVLAFTSKKSRAPKAEGIPYDKGAR
ncbi:MAG: ABC transporter permease [Clostridia bacterium]|nr:ABC transporter permease [Clostridia bacterium]